MRDRSALHTLVINSLEEQIAVIDQAGTIVDVNSAWTNFGIENGLASGFGCVGRDYLRVVCAAAADAGDDLAGEAAQGISDVLSGRRADFRHEYPCHGPEERRWFMMRVAALKDASGSLFVVSHHNITQRKLAELQVEHVSLHDALTGLANRRYFNRFLSNETRRSIRSRSTISLIAFDVDGFKGYNDELGHIAGDRCLVKVGQVLTTFSRRASDLAARIGGDEFALVLGDTGMEESRKIADAIKKKVNDLDIVYGGSRQVTISCGVASVVPETQQAEEFLLQEADNALYGEKAARRGQANPRHASATQA